MFADLVTPTERQVHDVDPVGVDNSERLRASLGVCTFIGGVMTKLHKMTGLAEGGFLKVYTVPFLDLLSY